MVVARFDLYQPAISADSGRITRLGGFLARHRDGHPGVTILRRGRQRLTHIAAAWLIFANTPLVGKG